MFVVVCVVGGVSNNDNDNNNNHNNYNRDETIAKIEQEDFAYLRQYDQVHTFFFFSLSSHYFNLILNKIIKIIAFRREKSRESFFWFPRRNSKF